MKGISEMKIDKEKTQLLKQELREYEKATPMTEEEREALHEWVAAGNSVHENGSMASYEGGRPIDFLDVYREEEEIRRALDSMGYDEGSKYLLEEYGIDRDGVTTPEPPTYEELKEKTNRLYKTCFLYREFLAANNLREEAYEYVRESRLPASRRRRGRCGGRRRSPGKSRSSGPWRRRTSGTGTTRPPCRTAAPAPC